MKKNIIIIILILIILILVTSLIIFISSKNASQSFSYFILTEKTTGCTRKEYYFFDKNNIETLCVYTFEFSEDAKDSYEGMKTNPAYQDSTYNATNIFNVSYNDETNTFVVIKKSGDWTKTDREKSLESQVINNSKENQKITLEKF